MTRVGIAIEGDEAAIIVTDGGEPTWRTIVRAEHSTAEIADAIARALAQSALPRWPRARANVALGSPHARVKRLHGIPPVKGRNALRALIDFNRDRFIASRQPLTVLGVQSVAPGEAVVGVADAEVVASLREALSRAPVRLRFVLPLATIDESSAESGNERDLMLDAATAAGVMHSPLALDACRSIPGESKNVPWWRMAAAATAFVCAVGVAAAAPLVRTMREIRADSVAARALATTADTAAQDARGLASARRDLRRVADFSNERASVTLLLNAIASALPESAVISTIHVDSAAVELVVLSPRTADVVDALGDVPGLSSPIVIGPVSREVVATRELDRATIRATIARGDPGRGTYGDPQARRPFAVDREMDGE